MGDFHKNMYSCTVNSCYCHDSRVDIVYQGGLCSYCTRLLNAPHNQALTCTYCGAIHTIRKKIRYNEPKHVEFGMCQWCIQRKKDEDKFKETYKLDIENTKLFDINNITENIFNKSTNTDDNNK